METVRRVLGSRLPLCFAYRVGCGNTCAFGLVEPVFRVCVVCVVFPGPGRSAACAALPTHTHTVRAIAKFLMAQIWHFRERQILGGGMYAYALT